MYLHPPTKIRNRSEAGQGLANLITRARARGECRFVVADLQERLAVLDGISGEPTTLHASLHRGR